MPKRFFPKLSLRSVLEWMLRRPVVIVLVISAATIFFALNLPRLSFRTSVYDLIIEGVSLVKNYRTQFREIIAKDSPEKLLEILLETGKWGKLDLAKFIHISPLCLSLKRTFSSGLLYTCKGSQKLRQKLKKAGKSRRFLQVVQGCATDS